MVAILLTSHTLLFAAIQNSACVGSGSDDLSILTQSRYIVSGLTKFCNLDTFDKDCVYIVALQQNGRIVGTFSGQEREGRPG